MKAIPMKGRLTGKRITGYLWAGPGTAWTKKENYFQLEHDKLVTAALSSASGSFTIRCKGGTLEITARNPDGEVLGTTILALPHARKR